MAKQVQIRRAVAATQNARTLAAGEPDFDTTNKRFCMHDGALAGGVPHVNYMDMQNQTWVAADASGTNTITITLARAPSAYAKYQAFTFKAAATITGAATFNVNGLGAKDIYKKNRATGAVVPVAAGDILIGGIYTVVYDGTRFQLMGVDAAGLTTVSQGDLNTLVGSVSVSSNSGTVVSSIVLPGGEFGFTPINKVTRTGTGGVSGVLSFAHVPVSATNTTFPTPYAARADISVTNTSAGSATFYAQQRYVSASPPFDMGDGEVGGFVFALLNPDGTIAATYNSDVPPWAYNGPTDIRACKKCPVTGQKYRRVLKKNTIKQILDGADVLEYDYEPITQKIKNADMKLIPHPFGGVVDGQSIVLLDPMDRRIERMMAYQNAGGDLAELLPYLRPDNERLRRKGPQGVMQVGFKN